MYVWEGFCIYCGWLHDDVATLGYRNLCLDWVGVCWVIGGQAWPSGALDAYFYGTSRARELDAKLMRLVQLSGCLVMVFGFLAAAGKLAVGAIL